ncbi:MAG: nucleoside deaminase [Campylobacterales bacterium]|nr:nucleoside deaminase [Campylobacterales bacterium]
MNHWMSIALMEAAEGMDRGEGGPFGAVIVKDGEVIARAHNEVLKTNDPTAHAEILAIRKASEALGTFDLSGCVLYASCYPCPMCMGAILWARIPTVCYGASMEDAAAGGFDDAHFYAMIRNPHTALDLRPAGTEKAKKLFERWLAKEDRRLY